MYTHIYLYTHIYVYVYIYIYIQSPAIELNVPPPIFNSFLWSLFASGVFRMQFTWVIFHTSPFPMFSSVISASLPLFPLRPASRSDVTNFPALPRVCVLCVRIPMAPFLIVLVSGLPGGGAHSTLVTDFINSIIST